MWWRDLIRIRCRKRLKRIVDPDSQATTFLYDFDGNLAEKKSAAATIHYVYAGGPAPLAEINIGTSTEKDYIQAGARIFGVKEASGNTYFHTDTWEYEPFGRMHISLLKRT